MNGSNGTFLHPLEVTQPERERRPNSLTKRQAEFLSEVQISLGVYVGELTMSVEQLIDLLPGQAFEFAFDARTILSLRVGEEEIAKAHFVLRDNKLAIEIVEIFSS